MAERQLTAAPYLTALDDLSSSELADRERAVQDTMNTRGWVVLCELWGAREEAKTEDLLRIKPGATAEKYAADVAFINGLREARQAPTALAEVAERKRQEALQQ